MPAAATIGVDKAEVRLIALQVGVRESARQFGLPEATVQAWSAREGWFSQRAIEDAKVQRIIEQKRTDAGLQPVATTALDVLGNYSGPTRLGHAKAAAKLAEKYAGMDPDELHECVPQLLGSVKHASITHNWNQQITNIGIRLDAVAGSLGVSVEQPGDDEAGEIE